MAKIRLLLLALALGTVLAARAGGQLSSRPDTVVLRSGALKLHALLWRPSGHGQFPSVLFSHGSGTNVERQLAQAATLGPVFSSHGYLFLFVFRRGSGLSADQGTSASDLMEAELAANGQEARNSLQLRLLETDELNDVRASLEFLRALPEVDRRRVALAGHSFGASLTLLMAERDTTTRAVVVFSGSAGSWEFSPQLRARLLAAVGRTTAPVFFIQAANDYSVAPAEALSAEMARLGKPYRVRIYPPVGATPEEGHDFLYRRVGMWESDVFDFLDGYMQR
jgi:dienelactone hydrolase